MLLYFSNPTYKSLGSWTPRYTFYTRKTYNAVPLFQTVRFCNADRWLAMLVLSLFDYPIRQQTHDYTSSRNAHTLDWLFRVLNINRNVFHNNRSSLLCCTPDWVSRMSSSKTGQGQLRMQYYERHTDYTVINKVKGTYAIFLKRM